MGALAQGFDVLAHARGGGGLRIHREQFLGQRQGQLGVVGLDHLIVQGEMLFGLGLHLRLGGGQLFSAGRRGLLLRLTRGERG